ncbi:OB-fold domain-containing protein [Nocardioides hungaricus]
MTTAQIPAVRPRINAEEQRFWDGTAAGKLLTQRCTQCGLHVSPPRGVCRRCGGRELPWVDVVAPGRVYTFTVNHNAWAPDAPADYVLVVVEFPEQDGIRFVGPGDLAPDEVAIGVPVGVRFELAPNGLHRPVFTPWPAA